MYYGGQAGAKKHGLSLLRAKKCWRWPEGGGQQGPILTALGADVNGA